MSILSQGARWPRYRKSFGSFFSLHNFPNFELLEKKKRNPPEGQFTDPFFPRINPNKTLGFLTHAKRLGCLPSHHSYSQLFLRKPNV
jgi:hypothetical protein